MYRYELPPTMQKRLTDYFSHRWECIKSNEKELVMAAKLLEELPPCVRYDAVECMTAEALAKVPLFARVEEGFIHALTQKMVAIMTSVGELLVTQGQVCDGLYIVLKGKLSIHVNGAQVNVIGVGSVVGEQSMLTGLPANATVTSLSFCEIYMLARGPFEELQHKFSDTFEGFKQAARLEAKNARKANKVKKGGKAGKMGGGAMGGADDPNDRKSMRGKLQRAATRTIIGGSDGDGRKLLGIVPIPILPHSRTRAVWAGLLLIFLTYDLLSLPFKLVFIGNYVDSGICALDVMSDLVIIADLIARSVLAFSEDGRLIDDVKLIRKRYFVRWRFIPLCISAVPTSMFLPLYPLIDARILQSLRVLRVVRRFSGSHDAHSRQQPSNLEELLRQVRLSLQRDLTPATSLPAASPSWLSPTHPRPAPNHHLSPSDSPPLAALCRPPRHHHRARADPHLRVRPAVCDQQARAAPRHVHRVRALRRVRLLDGRHGRAQAGQRQRRPNPHLGRR